RPGPGPAHPLGGDRPVPSRLAARGTGRGAVRCPGAVPRPGRSSPATDAGTAHRTAAAAPEAPQHPDGDAHAVVVAGDHPAADGGRRRRLDAASRGPAAGLACPGAAWPLCTCHGARACAAASTTPGPASSPTMSTTVGSDTPPGVSPAPATASRTSTTEGTWRGLWQWVPLPW